MAGVWAQLEHNLPVLQTGAHADWNILQATVRACTHFQSLLDGSRQKDQSPECTLAWWAMRVSNHWTWLNAVRYVFSSTRGRGYDLCLSLIKAQAANVILHFGEVYQFNDKKQV